MRGALMLGVWLLGAPVAEGEPGLLETIDAAARSAGGTEAADAARVARARASHWAPQVRAQMLVRQEERTRDGEYRLAPVREDDLVAGRTWSVMVTWDLAQVLFAREEAQLAIAQMRLARARRDAADRAAQLWIERRGAQALWVASRTEEACLALLRATAALVAITGGLFRDVLHREEATCAKGGR